MRAVIVVGIAAVVVTVRLTMRRRLRRRKSHGSPRRLGLGPFTGDVALVASREVRERIRGRVFRVGTLFILLVVAAVIVIPVLNKSKPTTERLGVVGALANPLRRAVIASATSIGTTVKLVPQTNASVARPLCVRVTWTWPSSTDGHCW
jgi:hypothetical protein